MFLAHSSKVVLRALFKGIFTFNLWSLDDLEPFKYGRYINSLNIGKHFTFTLFKFDHSNIGNIYVQTMLNSWHLNFGKTFTAMHW